MNKALVILMARLIVKQVAEIKSGKVYIQEDEHVSFQSWDSFKLAGSKLMIV